MSQDIHGWYPADILPITDPSEGESGYLLILCVESAAPVIGYYSTGYLEATGRYVPALSKTAHKQLTARWWRPLDPVPASILPPGQRRWALSTGLAFVDDEEMI